MNRLFGLVEHAQNLATKLQWVALGVARWTLGLEFISTGWGKVHHLDRVTAYFGELGIPAPGANAVVASFTKLICGTLLFVGLGSRLAACPLIVTMVVAIVTAKRDELHGVTDLVGLLEWSYIAILIGIVLLGPGGASLDAVAARVRRHSNT